VRSLGNRGTRFRKYDAPEAAGDVDGDGRPDLVVEDRVVLGADTASGPTRGWSTTESVGLLPIGDVNRDGRADLLTFGFGTPCWSEESGYAFVSGTGTAPKPPPYGRPTPKDDRLIGSNRGDVIDGGKGNDRLEGRGGPDCLTGGDDDSFEAEPEDTYIAPRPDADRLAGGKGADELDGGAGNDLVSGGRGNDRLFGGSDRDVLRGGPGRDLLVGYYDYEDLAARDRYFGGPGNDRIEAEDGARNVIDCGPGRDTAVVDKRDRVTHCETVRRHNLYG
jgi:Ca2+-binding RTX toxin-like protein